MDNAERTEGWGSLDNVRAAHYFRDGKTFCRRWMTLGTPRWETNQKLGASATHGTCKACWKKLAEEAARTVKPSIATCKNYATDSKYFTP